MNFNNIMMMFQQRRQIYLKEGHVGIPQDT